MKTHGIPGQFNIYTRDTDSVVTGYGKHARVSASIPQGGEIYCRVDLLEGLPEPTEKQILTVCRKSQLAKGRWVLKSRTPWEGRPSIDFIFARPN